MEHQVRDEDVERLAAALREKRTTDVLAGFVIVVVAAAAVGGMYFWQHGLVKKFQAQTSSLQAQLTAANKKVAAAQTAQKASEQPKAFTYSPKTGGLSLTLPTSYGLSVLVDGNKGGAPGATFRVTQLVKDNIYSDPAYGGVQVDIDNTFKDLNSSVQSAESQMKTQKDSNLKVTDTKVAGLPAKLIAADGPDEYIGHINVYVVGSGSFQYTITANGVKTTLGATGGSTNTLSTGRDTLVDVLDGLKITPKTL